MNKWLDKYADGGPPSLRSLISNSDNRQSSTRVAVTPVRNTAQEKLNKFKQEQAERARVLALKKKGQSDVSNLIKDTGTEFAKQVTTWTGATEEELETGRSGDWTQRGQMLSGFAARAMAGEMMGKAAGLALPVIKEGAKTFIPEMKKAAQKGVDHVKYDTPFYNLIKPNTIQGIHAKNIHRELGERLDARGAYNQGVFHLKRFPGYVTKIEPTKGLSKDMGFPEYPNYDFVKAMQHIDDPTIAKVQNQFNSLKDPNLRALIMNKVEGKSLDDLTAREMRQIPPEALTDLYGKIKGLRDNNLAFDFMGQNMNYNPQLKKFGLYDINPGYKRTDPTNDWHEEILGSMHKEMFGSQASAQGIKDALTHKLRQQYWKNQYEPLSKAKFDGYYVDPKKRDVLLGAADKIKASVRETLRDLPHEKNGGETGWLSKYADGGPKKPGKPAPYKVKNWMANYMESPVYKQRLANFDDIDPMDQAKTKLVRSVPIHHVEGDQYLGSQTMWPTDKGIHSITIDPKDLDKSRSTPGIAYENNAFGYEEVLAHELSHASRQPSNKESLRISDLLKNPYEDQARKDYDNLKGADKKKFHRQANLVGMTPYNFWVNSENLEVKYPNKGVTSHDLQADENKADLDALRYQMYKYGIYDTSKGPLDEATLIKALDHPKIKESITTKRLQVNFGREQIIKFNNEIASVKKTPGIPTAQNGGQWLAKYTDGGEKKKGNKTPPDETFEQYAKKYRYRGPREFNECVGEGCAKIAGKAAANLTGISYEEAVPQNAWFKKDAITKAGGIEVYNATEGLSPQEASKRFRIGDQVTMNRPWHGHQNEVSTVDTSLKNEGTSHAGAVYGFDDRGVAMIKHGHEGGKSYVDPIDSLQLDDLGLKYTLSSGLRTKAQLDVKEVADDKYFRETQPAIPLTFTDNVEMVGDKQKFVDAYNRNSDLFQRASGLSADDVAAVGAVAYGVFGNESNFNQFKGRNILRKPKQILATIAHAFGRDAPASLGPTQLKYDYAAKNEDGSFTKKGRLMNDLGTRKGGLSLAKGENYDDVTKATFGVLAENVNRMKSDPGYEFNPENNTVFGNVPLAYALARSWKQPDLKKLKKVLQRKDSDYSENVNKNGMDLNPASFTRNLPDVQITAPKKEGGPVSWLNKYR